MGAPRRLTTAVVADCTFFDVLRHEIVDEGQSPRSVYTLEMADWVSVLAVTEDGQFVLVEQHRHGVDRPTLETPGGIVDPGEEPSVTALRELVEETGYQGDVAEPLGWVHPNPALSANKCHFFLARGVRRIAEPENHPYERTAAVLVDRPALERALTDGTFTHALVVIAVERALARLPAVEPDWMRRVVALLDAMEETQRGKVIELARRLKPGLTAEDVRNPHDFPDLDDPDWHFEDGQLTGIQSVRFALRSLSEDRDRG